MPGNGPDSGKQVHHAESLSSKDESEIWSTGIPVTILNSLFWNNLEFWEKMKEEYYLHALYPDFQFLRYYHSCFILFVLSFMYMYIILIEFISFKYLWFIYTNKTYMFFLLSHITQLRMSWKLKYLTVYFLKYKNTLLGNHRITITIRKLILI